MSIKFVVKASRGGLAPAFVQRIDPPHMTTNRKLALIMGKFTAEDAIKSIQNSKCVPELVLRAGRRLAESTAGNQFSASYFRGVAG